MKSILVPLILSLSLGGLVAPSQGQTPARLQPGYNCRTREVWSAAKKAWCDNQAERNPYQVIDLQQLARKPLTGPNPRSVALAAFGTQEPAVERSFKQTVTVNRRNPERTVVVITETGFGDDSVRGFRYRVELIPTGTAARPRWQIDWAGKQWTCQPGRGSQRWGTILCV